MLGKRVIMRMVTVMVTPAMAVTGTHSEIRAPGTRGQWPAPRSLWTETRRTGRVLPDW